MYRKFISIIGQLNKQELENLYNYISLDIKHVGPAIADNYLLIFDIASRKKIGYCLKRMLLQSILYIIVALGIIYFIL